MNYGDYSLKKHEILKNKKLISELYSRGKFYIRYPIKFFYIENKIKLPNHQILFCVPKKNIKKAIYRNTIKRKLKEAYRYKKIILNDLLSFKSFNFAIIYLETEDKFSVDFFKEVIDNIFSDLIEIKKLN